MNTSKGAKKSLRSKSPRVKNTDSLASLRAKLKGADPEIHNYVIGLQAENLNLQKQIGRLQAQNTTFENRIKVLTEKIKAKGPSLEDKLRRIKGQGSIPHESSEKE